MKKVFQVLKFAGFLAFISFMAIACDQDFNSIESEVINLKNFNTNQSQAPVTSYNKKLDSLTVSNLSAHLLGVFNDPAFGQTTASIITQITPTEFSPVFGDNPVIDSVVLTISYNSRLLANETNPNGNALYSISDSLYGNQSAPIKLSIYQNNFFLRDFNPTADLEVTQNYYSHGNGSINTTDNFAVIESGIINFDDSKGALIYENNNFIPSSSAIVLKTLGTDGAETTQTIAPALRTTLNIDFWKAAIFDLEGDDVLSNANNFYDYFRGLYFKAEAINADGSMLLLDISDSGSNITIYYSNDPLVEGGDRIKDTYVLNSSGNKLNPVINNYNLVSLQNGDATNGDEKLYLKGAEGSMAIVDIFSGNVDCNGSTETALDCFKKTYRAVDENGDYILKNGDFLLKRLLNEAQLIIYEDENMALPTQPSDKYTDPKDFHKYDRIYAYDIKNNTPLIDYTIDPSTNSISPFNSKFIHLGQRDTDENGISKYKIRITEHLNNILLKDSTNTKIGLVLSTNVNYISNAPILRSNDIVTGVPAASVITPRGTVLYGSHESVPVEKRMRLDLYFTESNTND